MVTAATYQKQPFFRSAKRLTFLCEMLLTIAKRYEWKLEAWAVFPNHYHFVATSERPATNLRAFIGNLHVITAREINRADGAQGRKVWFQYWDTHLTYPRSCLARLNYVHSNAVSHRLVKVPSQYEWCSAAWFEREADPALYKTVMGFHSDHVNVEDNFTVSPEDVR